MGISYMWTVHWCSSGAALPRRSPSTTGSPILAPTYNGTAVFKPPISDASTAVIFLPRYFSISSKAFFIGSLIFTGFLVLAPGAIVPTKYGTTIMESLSSSSNCTTSILPLILSASSRSFNPSLGSPPPPVPRIVVPRTRYSRSRLSLSENMISHVNVNSLIPDINISTIG